ncbi:uncharacterized protein LOC126836856 [Adelges cooleyi]|uniref:uncharacterized protein LOC126836856 n=1 Tax=Adelges cooleyi TaxID=133065 RepID=UPI00217FA8DA|nr:uncharacterized protein LOC126836856 [Adelges cooleyi]
MKVIVIALYVFVCLASVEPIRSPIQSFLPAKASALKCLSNKHILQYAKNDPQYEVDAELLHFALNLKKSKDSIDDQKAVDEYIDNFCSSKTTIKTQIEMVHNLRVDCRTAMKECATDFLNKLV